jgi:predicted thioesterase
MDTREQAIYLMASTSMGTGEIAATLGVSPSLISQYKEDAEFLNAVASRRMNVSISEIRRDDKKDKIEDTLLEKLDGMAEMMFDPKMVLVALRTVGSLERRSRHKEAPQSGIPEGQTVVSVVLPRHLKEATVEVKVSTNNEIVEVGGRAMVNMGAAQVLEQMNNRIENRKEQLALPKDKIQQAIDQF